MSTIYVSKSGNNGNAGTSYALSKLTISAAISVSSSGDSIVVGSGVYNEYVSLGVNLTLLADGNVVMDGTSLAANPAITLTAYVNLTIGAYSQGGWWMFQNYITTGSSVPALSTSTNAIISTSGYNNNYTISNCIFIGTGSRSQFALNGMNTYSPTFQINNCVFSNFACAMILIGSNTNSPQGNITNNTLYNCGIGLWIRGTSSQIVNIVNNIISNVTTAIQFPNNNCTNASTNYNIYYAITNWKTSGNTYTTLPAWAAAVGSDANSLVQNPNFVDANNNVFYLTSNPNTTNNAYLYYGAYPYGLTRGNVYNPDNKWLITGSFDNSGWYNPDGNITMVSSLFQLTTGTVGVIWSPVYDLGSSQTISQFGIEAFQVWPGSMVDTTKTDVRPNYQTSEIRASAVTFNQNDGVIAWAELKNKIPFTSQGSTNLTGRFVQLRLTLRADDVAA